MKYKHIKSAAHNFAHSFSSLMNFGPGDYVMAYLAHGVVTYGEPELRVDLLTGTAEPQALLSAPVRDSIRSYHGRFPQHLASHNVSVNAIRRATLRVRFEPDRRTASHAHPGMFQMPFESSVEVEDDRGKVHLGKVRDFWMGEEDPDNPSNIQPRDLPFDL